MIVDLERSSTNNKSIMVTSTWEHKRRIVLISNFYLQKKKQGFGGEGASRKIKNYFKCNRKGEDCEQIP